MKNLTIDRVLSATLPESKQHNTKGMTLGFKTRYETLDFVDLIC